MAEDQTGYQYPKSTNSDEYSKSSITGGTENIKSVLTSKRFLTVAGLAALIFFIMIRREYTPEAIQDKPPIVTTPVVTPAVPVPPIAPPPIIPPAHDKTLDNIQLAMTNINGLTSRMTSMENNVSELLTQQQNNSQQLSTVTTDMQNVTDVLQKLIDSQKPKVQKKPAVVPVMTFYIQALIQGRAWITQGDKNYTVVEGDALPTYGVITLINADAGIIETSSGRNILFPQRTL